MNKADMTYLSAPFFFLKKILILIDFELYFIKNKE